MTNQADDGNSQLRALQEGRHFHGLSRDMLLYGVMQAVSKLSAFLLVPVFTRIFSATEYGSIDILITLAALVTVFAGVNLNSSVARYYFAVENPAQRRELISSSFNFVLIVSAALGALGGLVAGPIASLLLDDAGRSGLVVLVLVAVFFTAPVHIPEIVLRMERRVVAFNLLGLVKSLSFAGLALFLVIVQGLGIAGVIWAMVISAALRLLLATWWTRSYLGLTLDLASLNQTLRYGLPMLPAVAMTWLNNQADRLILLLFLGLGGVGVFGAAARIAAIGLLFATIFRSAWTPYAMIMMKAPSGERNHFYRRALRYYIGFFSLFGLLLTAASPELFEILVADEFYAGYVLLPWLVGAVALHSAGSITSVGVLLSERTGSNSIAATIGAATNVAFAFVLIPAFGLSGAAIGSFVAEFLFMSILWYYSVRLSDVRFEVGPALGVLTCYIVAAAGLLWISKSVQHDQWSIGGRVIVLLVAVLLIGNWTVDDSIRRLGRKWFSRWISTPLGIS